MIEWLFVLAVLAAVVPLAVDREGGRRFLGAAAALAAAFLPPAGALAGILALPWAVVAVGFAARRLSGWVGPGPGRLERGLGSAAAAVFLAVGAIAAVLSRLGARPLGFDEPIALLTAVHFHVAGFVLLTVALRIGRRFWPAERVAVPLLVLGIPATAAGFLGAAEIGLTGAWLVAAAGIVVAAAHLELAISSHGTADRWLASAAGLSLSITMPLAAGWASASYLGMPFLAVGAMAATHGLLNVLGFAVPAAALWRRRDATRDRRRVVRRAA